MVSTEQLASEARDASRVVATISADAKAAFLRDLADGIAAARREVRAANERDLADAARAGLAQAKLQRLGLSDAALGQTCDGVRQIAAMPDPVGRVTADRVVPSGLRVRKVRAPLGVVCMIYEARPAVTIDAFALCFKAGNACILKGGKEAAGCAGVLAGVARTTLARHGLPAAALTVIGEAAPHQPGPDARAQLRELLRQDRFIDLVIPRGGPDLIRFVREHSRIPTIQHFQGVCHVYVDASADPDLAERVCVTAKAGAPATCNAAECVLVDRAIAREMVPRLAQAFGRAGVEVRADEQARALAPWTTPATDTDFGREFLDLIVALRVVDGLDGAIAHIDRFGSDHTEAILTRDRANADEFCRRVRSSCVVVNASTRFNDGYQLGLGAEIGISTTRLHAYGPMGLDELTIERYVVDGDGQTR